MTADWTPAVEAALAALAPLSGGRRRLLSKKPTAAPGRIATMLALRDLGMPPDDVGEAFGIHPATVAAACARARCRLDNAAFRALVAAASHAARPHKPSLPPPASRERRGARLQSSTVPPRPSPPDSSWDAAQLKRLEAGIRSGRPYGELAAELGVTKNAVVSRAARSGYAPARPRGNPSALAANAPPPQRCQWIEGPVPECLDADGGAPFCGLPVDPGSSYCPEHRSVITARSAPEVEA